MRGALALRQSLVNGYSASGSEKGGQHGTIEAGNTEQEPSARIRACHGQMGSIGRYDGVICPAVSSKDKSYIYTKTRPSGLVFQFLIAPAAALAREVHPLGVTELVADEVQMAVPRQRTGQEAEDLVHVGGAVHRRTVISRKPPYCSSSFR